MEHSVMESLREVRESRTQGENGREKSDFSICVWIVLYCRGHREQWPHIPSVYVIIICCCSRATSQMTPERVYLN